MRKIYLAMLALVAFAGSHSLKAQNVQMHYDFGKSIYTEQSARPALTTTVEMFRPDKWGSTFFFVDMNYQDKGVQSAYWEIARDIRLWKTPIALHVEYNGGTSNAFSYNDAYLLGANYSYNAKDFSWGFGITPMYKYLTQLGGKHSAQLTATWYAHFAKGLVTFTGFADLWGDHNGQAYTVFLTEPQLWVNLNKIKGVSSDFNLSIGGELEVSYNFPYQNKQLYAIPTLAVKWSF